MNRKYKVDSDGIKCVNCTHSDLKIDHNDDAIRICLIGCDQGDEECLKHYEE